MKYHLEKAKLEDKDSLVRIFWRHINDRTEYISHGELQMGVGEAEIIGNEIVTRPAKNGMEMWLKYIEGNLTSPDRAAVFKAVDESGEIAGFSVAEITEDGADPFGMVCDVLVAPEHRSQGIGNTLLTAAIEWLEGNGIKDIYLESGKDNHSAHEFFKKRGFCHISEIFKLK